MQGGVKRTTSRRAPRLRTRSPENSFKKVSRIQDAEDKEQAAALLLQQVVRSKVIANQHLHRSNLAERLLFESSVLWETARFLNQVLVFALLLGSLRLSSDEVQKRGIFENLQDTFNFDDLKAIRSRQDFIASLPVITSAAKDYFLLSSEYFDVNGAGSKQLIRDVIAFTAPASAGPMDLSGVEFSFTAWVRTGPNFLRGYILQKPSGDGLSCWAWHLHGSYGPELHYGGHDFFPADAKYPADSNAGQERQIEVGFEPRVGFPPNKFELLTLAVTETHVSFFRNTELLGTSPLPAPLSDCINDGRGILTGDAGLEIGDLRYHPTALTSNQIEELWFNGGSLVDMSTGSQPETHIISDIEALDGSVTSSLAALDDKQTARKVSTDINFVIDRVEDPAEYHSPPAPTGTTLANPTPMHDAATGRDYSSLYLGPGRLTETTADHRYIEGQPSFANSGASISFWYRHHVCADPFDACGVYFLVAYEEGTDDVCWSLWLEKTKLWYDNPKATPGNPTNQYPPFGFPEKFNLNSDKAWRHITMVFNEQTDEIEFYMDGTFVVKAVWGSPISSTASCTSSNPRLSFGHQDPGYTYGAEVDVYDLRMYVHGPEGPLDAEEIRNMSKAATPGLNDDYKCLVSTAREFEEQEWLDAYGHDCSWYGRNAKDFPAVCNFPNAAKMCPISCSSRQECWMNAQPVNAYYSWRGIKRIEPGLDSNSGSLCVDDRQSREDLVRQCEAWVANGVPESVLSSDWYVSFKAEGDTEDRRGKRLDLRDCQQIAHAIEQDCTMNASAIRAFTRESEDNQNGDFTISFWMRPLGEAAINEYTDTFIPHLQFLSSFSPPTHNLAVGLWANPNGEARFFSDCDENKFDNIELKSASKDGWTFFAISRKHRQGDVKGEGATLTNVGKRWEGSNWRSKQCLFNPEAFFTALEVNYPVLMSPIMMVPAYVPVSSLQQTYQGLVDEMQSKSGAASTTSGVAAGITVEKQTFAAPMILVAPPMMFQTRAHPADTCPSKFGKKIIETQHSQMLKTQCAFPFVCDDVVTSSPSMLLACAGDPVEDKVQFGLQASDFREQGKTVRGYADFLASVTEPVFLFREGTLYETKDFIDTLTQSAQVLLVFWNPEASTTTVMTVRADFASTSSAKVDVSIEHYELLEGGQLDIYVFVQILVLVNVAMMFIDIAFNLKNTFLRVIADRKAEAEELAQLKREREAEYLERQKQSQSFKGTETLQRAQSSAAQTIAAKIGPDAIIGIIRDVLKSVGELLRDLMDCVIAVLVIVYVAARLPTKIVSASKTDETVGALGQIDWGSTELKREDKVEQFFSAMNELLDTIRGESNLNAFCNLVLLFSLLRLIKCTSMHPRLALLEGTVRKAWDDLWHAAILIVLLMLCFAGIGAWRFGGYREDFRDAEAACQTLFMMTFGEFPDDWTNTRDLQLYTVLYFMLVFLLVQNFLLAVIVEAYMGVRKDNEDLETEQEFVLDIASSFTAHWKAYRKGWPTPHKLGSEVAVWEARYSVGFSDLWNTGWFRTREAVVEFMKYYRSFEFLDPIPFDEYGPEIKDEKEKMAHDLELRLGKAMGLKIQTLKEFADEKLQFAAERRRLKQTHTLAQATALAAAKLSPAPTSQPARSLAGQISPAMQPIAAVSAAPRADMARELGRANGSGNGEAGADSAGVGETAAGQAANFGVSSSGNEIVLSDMVSASGQAQGKRAGITDRATPAATQAAAGSNGQHGPDVQKFWEGAEDTPSVSSNRPSRGSQSLAAELAFSNDSTAQPEAEAQAPDEAVSSLPANPLWFIQQGQGLA